MWPRKKQKPINVGSGEFVSVESYGLRRPTTIERQEINLFYNYGGVGDFIYWTTVIDWIYSTHEHLFGTVLAPKFFYELAKHWLSHLSDRVEVRPYVRLETDKFFMKSGKYFLGPNGAQLSNSCGAHLLDIGFRYYANLDKIPDGWDKMPVIRGDEVSVSQLNLPKNYVVVTTEATSPIRKLRAEAVNGITKWLILQGITPVFLGKRELAHDYKAVADEGLDLGGVLDLREATGLLEAACVLSGARAVVGLDNGLLHLACCSKVPVVMGFNTVDPTHRAPFRAEGSGKVVAVIPGPSLECRFCQSRVRFVMGHNFHNCLYGDSKCLDMLPAEQFISALIKVLGPEAAAPPSPAR